jgi:hypothetical protein
MEGPSGDWTGEKKRGKGAIYIEREERMECIEKR